MRSLPRVIGSLILMTACIWMWGYCLENNYAPLWLGGTAIGLSVFFGVWLSMYCAMEDA